MTFDFQAARKRREQLLNTYRTMKDQYEDDDTWSWWILGQIEEIDREIVDARQVRQADPSVSNVLPFPGGAAHG
jgi:hypothetical protein